MSTSKHFTLLCLYDKYSVDDTGMVGTFDNCTDDTVGMQSLRERMCTALESYFDGEIRLPDNFQELIENVFGGCPYEDLEVMVADFGHEHKSFSPATIRIYETWIF